MEVPKILKLSVFIPVCTYVIYAVDVYIISAHTCIVREESRKRLNWR